LDIIYHAFAEVNQSQIPSQPITINYDYLVIYFSVISGIDQIIYYY